MPDLREALIYTPEQARAMDEIERWYRTGRTQIFRLSGYAGTGKTTVARDIPSRLGVEAQYAAFTGKAASVLRAKGCEGASTLHSLLYRSKEVDVKDERGRPVWRVAPKPILDEDGKQIGLEPGKALTKMSFEPRDPDEGDEPLSDVDLFIVDEMSMLGQQVVDDLLNVGVRVLVLGDPGQLPPIRGGENTLTSGEPDVLLRSVQRNQGRVLDLATMVRAKGAESIEPHEVRRISVQDLAGFDQVLVWKNITRWKMIRNIRRELGRPAAQPVPGDRIMFLANRPDEGRFNGQQATVLDVFGGDERDPNIWDLMVCDDDGRTDCVTVPRLAFKDRSGQEEAEHEYRRSKTVIPATFAQAVTVHKAQGSEWGSVCVLNETAGMNDGGLAKRWLYTAITRASKDVTIVAQGGW